MSSPGRELLSCVVILMIMLLIQAASCGDTFSCAAAVEKDPPEILSVVARDSTHVEVGFSESVQEESATDPRNYEIYRIEGNLRAKSLLENASEPGDTLYVDMAELLEDRQTVQLSIRPGMHSDYIYRLICSNIADLLDNVMTEPDSMSFAGAERQSHALSQVFH